MRVRINIKGGLSEIELHTPDERTLDAALHLAHAIEKHGDEKQAKLAGNMALAILDVKECFALFEPAEPDPEEATP